MSIRKWVFVIGMIAFVSVLVTGQTTWTPEMQVRTKTLATPRISPDGKRVVYTVSEAVMTPDKSEFISQIWMATTDGKENYQVTFGDKSSTNAKVVAGRKRDSVYLEPQGQQKQPLRAAADGRRSRTDHRCKKRRQRFRMVARWATGLRI